MDKTEEQKALEEYRNSKYRWISWGVILGIVIVLNGIFFVIY